MDFPNAIDPDRLRIRNAARIEQRRIRGKDQIGQRVAAGALGGFLRIGVLPAARTHEHSKEHCDGGFMHDMGIERIGRAVTDFPMADASEIRLEYVKAKRGGAENAENFRRGPMDSLLENRA
jgi:hypothetical protein